MNGGETAQRRGLRITVFGDSFIGVEDFKKAFASLSGTNLVRFVRLDESKKLVPATASEKMLREYLGSTEQLIAEMGDTQVLVVHGAPISESVIQAGSSLKMVCCARGGPVNVDISAATKRRIPVVTAPGKNAEAVAELAIALMVMLSRNIIGAYESVRQTRVVGKDNYEGAKFIGHELDGKVLGLVGYGRVGSRVAKRALSFGMSILVYDPYVSPSRIETEGVSVAGLDQVLAKSDFISIHARESKENEKMIGRKEFSSMKQGAYFINTSRPSLVDEEALLEALKSKKLAGAALDVVAYDPTRPVNPLLDMEGVIVMPHIGGATYETTTKGAVIVARQIERYLRGEALETVVNPEVLGR